MAKLMGIDVGSTTVKVALLGEDREILYTSYERHFSKVKECVLSRLAAVREKFGGDVKVSITGSAGLGLAQRSGVSFVQEVQAADFNMCRKKCIIIPRSVWFWES